MELLKPNIKWEYNKNKFLTFISVILIIVAFITVLLNIYKGSYKNGIYDTMIYGFGFPILFLLTINYSIWMKVLLWTRLIEFWGPLTGYNLIPAVFGRYTGGAFGHFGYGPKGMIISPYFWTDFSVGIISVLGVMYLLRKAGFKWFWIISFSVGAVITGFALTYILPALLK